MKKLLSLFLSLCFAVSVVAIPSFTNADEMVYSYSPVEHCVVHDPSIIKGEDNRYYMVGSHLVMSESDDLINWKNNDYDIRDGYPNYFGDWQKELAEPLSWCDSYQRVTHDKYDPTIYETFEKNCWANDAIFNPHTGEYMLYGCCSVWGTTASVIWLATSKDIKGPYTYQKSFVYSGVTRNSSKSARYNGLYFEDTNIQTDIINSGYMTKNQVILNEDWFDEYTGYYRCGWGDYPNAIDPTAFFDENGDLWLVYGSFSGGCYVLKMNNNTGTPDYDYMSKTDGYDIYFGKQISKTNADTDGTGEGPFIIYDAKSGYYYFFLTYGGLGGHGGYNIREYRSKSPEGPYVDAAGNSAIETHNTGLKLIGNYGLASTASPYVSPGHSSCLIDSDGSMYQAYHTRFANDNGWGFQTRVHKMARTKDGWSVILPLEYQGEQDTTVTQDDIVGEWELVDFQNISHTNADDANIYDIVVPTQSITLNADGTITGARKYISDKNHTNLGFKDVSGTWSLDSDGVNANFTIGTTKYIGVFARQFDESSEACQTVVFSAKGNDNSTIWGVSKSNLSHDVVAVSTVMSNCTEYGYTVYKCKNCNYNYKGKFIAPKSHSCSTTLKPASPKANGSKRIYCRFCNYVQLDKIIYSPKTVTLSTTKYVYDGKAKKPTVTVKDSKGNKISASSYSVVYSNNTKVGTASVKVIFNGDYSDTLSSTFVINPKNTTSLKVVPKSKGFTASWKKYTTQITGYQLQYSTSSNFSSPKMVTLSKTATKYTVQKLKSKKKYFVRVRTYTTVSGKKYYSSWSGAKAVTTK